MIAGDNVLSNYGFSITFITSVIAFLVSLSYMMKSEKNKSEERVGQAASLYVLMPYVFSMSFSGWTKFYIIAFAGIINFFALIGFFLRTNTRWYYWFSFFYLIFIYLIILFIVGVVIIFFFGSNDLIESLKSLMILLGFL